MKLSAGRVIGLILLATLVEASAAYNVLDHWTRRATNNVNRVRFVGGQFVAVGNNGLIMTSSNGANWTVRNSGISQALWSVAYGYLGFLAVGDNNTVLASSDANTWTTVNMGNVGINIKDVSHHALGIARYICVGEPWYGYANAPNIVIFDQPGWGFTPRRITNALDWCDAGQLAVFRSVVRASNTWVAVGDICTGIWTGSSFGTSWTYRPGTNFTYQQYRRGVAYGDGVAVSVGNEGPPHSAVSPFTNWIDRLIVTNGSNFLNYYNYAGEDIAFGDRRFVVPRGTEMLETTNGQNWVIHGSSSWGTTIAYGAGCFVTASYTGIYQSDNIAGLLAARRPNATGPVELSLTIEPQRAFGIQATTNFTQWTEIWRGTNTSGGTPQFLDWSVTNGISRYYRTVTP